MGRHRCPPPGHPQIQKRILRVPKPTGNSRWRSKWSQSGGFSRGIHKALPGWLSPSFETGSAPTSHDVIQWKLSCLDNCVMVYYSTHFKLNVDSWAPCKASMCASATGHWGWGCARRKQDTPTTNWVNMPGRVKVVKRNYNSEAPSKEARIQEFSLLEDTVGFNHLLKKRRTAEFILHYLHRTQTKAYSGP